jgi:hypothetical protein
MNGLIETERISSPFRGEVGRRSGGGLPGGPDHIATHLPLRCPSCLSVLSVQVEQFSTKRRSKRRGRPPLRRESRWRGLIHGLSDESLPTVNLLSRSTRFDFQQGQVRGAHRHTPRRQLYSGSQRLTTTFQLGETGGDRVRHLHLSLVDVTILQVPAPQFP